MQSWSEVANLLFYFAHTKPLFENLDSAAAHTPAEMRLQAYFLGYAVGPAGFKTASKE